MNYETVRGIWLPWPCFRYTRISLWRKICKWTSSFFNWDITILV